MAKVRSYITLVSWNSGRHQNGIKFPLILSYLVKKKACSESRSSSSPSDEEVCKVIDPISKPPLLFLTTSYRNVVHTVSPSTFITEFERKVFLSTREKQLKLVCVCCCCYSQVQ